MTFTYDFRDGSYFEIEGKQVRFWLGEGLPNYKGELDGFAELYPIYVKELVTKGFLRESK